MTIGTRIAELRTLSGQSQSQLAASAGVPLGTLQALEQGRYNPRWDTVVALAGALGVGLGPLGEPSTTDEADRPKRGRPKTKEMND